MQLFPYLFCLYILYIMTTKCSVIVYRGSILILYEFAANCSSIYNLSSCFVLFISSLGPKAQEYVNNV